MSFETQFSWQHGKQQVMGGKAQRMMEEDNITEKITRSRGPRLLVFVQLSTGLVLDLAALMAGHDDLRGLPQP